MTSAVLVEEMPEQVESKKAQSSLMTPVGVVEGEIIAYLEQHDTSTLRELTRNLNWQTPMVWMAVGALIRAGLVRGVRRDLEIIVKLRTPLCELQ